jgi:hypothetical protein
MPYSLITLHGLPFRVLDLRSVDLCLVVFGGSSLVSFSRVNHLDVLVNFDL